VKDSGHGEELARQVVHPVPFLTVLLTAPLKRAPPEVEDMVSEGAGRTVVGRHGEVVEVPRDHLLQPSALLGDGPVHALSQTLLDLLQLRPHAVGSGLPFNQEVARARFAADEGEAEEGEGLRFSQTPPLAFRRRMAAEFDEAGLVRMQRQSKLP
jgi:hypothetical protein